MRSAAGSAAAAGESPAAAAQRGGTLVCENRTPYDQAPARRPRLGDRARAALRLRHLSRRTERAYLHWMGRFPIVLSRAEVRHVLAAMNGTPRLMATLLYGSGLRLLECCQLRVEDLDFTRRQLTVRQAKGDKDRWTMLPATLLPALRKQLAGARDLHTRDLAAGAGHVGLPGALARKLPSASRDWSWPWVFPVTRTYVDHETGQRRCHHLHETVVRIDCSRRKSDVSVPLPSGRRWGPDSR